MYKLVSSAILIFAFTLFSQASAQQVAVNELRRQTMEIQRQAVVAQNLPMSDEEAEDFWPAYYDYRKDIKEFDDTRLELITLFGENMGTLDEELSTDLVGRATALEVNRQKAKRKHMAQFKRIIPGPTLFRLYQIETKLDALHTASWTRQIPLAPIEKQLDFGFGPVDANSPGASASESN